MDVSLENLRATLEPKWVSMSVNYKALLVLIHIGSFWKKKITENVGKGIGIDE